MGGELLFLAGKTQMALSASDLKKALALLFPGESSSGLITSAAPAADPYNLSRPEATPEGNVVAVKRISPRYGMTARRSPAVRPRWTRWAWRSPASRSPRRSRMTQHENPCRA